MAHISPDFIQHIQKQLPANIQLEELLEACQRPLRKSLRANLLSSTPEILQAELESLGYTLTPIPWCDEGFWIDETEKAPPDNLGNWLPHLQGQCYIQEASSMLPVKALLHDFSYSESSTFLDMAAAPGSKTTQLAAQLNNQGLIVANELSSSRLKGLHHNLQRCGVKNTALSHADGRLFGDKTPQFFDAILLDAPCGGEGTVRKDEQALANWDIASVQSISELQKELICSAYRALKPGGRLVYSTCTLSKEENQDVCDYLLQTYGEDISVKTLAGLFEGADKAVTQEGYLHVYPNTYDCEGFFVACFEKSTKVEVTKTALSDSQHKKFTHLPQKTFEQLQSYCGNFGWDISPLRDKLKNKSNRGRNEEVWYINEDMEALNQQFKLNRFGIKLFELNKHGPKLQHQAVVSFGQDFTQQIVPLSSEQARDYYQGKDIFLEHSHKPPQHKEVIVTYQGAPLGLAKHLGNKLKNNLPRDLVRDKAF